MYRREFMVIDGRAKCASIPCHLWLMPKEQTEEEKKSQNKQKCWQNKTYSQNIMEK